MLRPGVRDARWGAAEGRVLEGVGCRRGVTCSGRCAPVVSEYLGGGGSDPGFHVLAVPWDNADRVVGTVEFVKHLAGGP